MIDYLIIYQFILYLKFINRWTMNLTNISMFNFNHILLKGRLLTVRCCVSTYKQLFSSRVFISSLHLRFSAIHQWIYLIDFISSCKLSIDLLFRIWRTKLDWIQREQIRMACFSWCHSKRDFHVILRLTWGLYIYITVRKLVFVILMNPWDLSTYLLNKRW